MAMMRPYYPDNPDLCFCPTASKSRDETADSTFRAWTNFYDEHGSYGINICITNPLPGREGGISGVQSDDWPEWMRRFKDYRFTALILTAEVVKTIHAVILPAMFRNW